ncbi:MAG: threonylcarbamoyl-AMP synthase [Bacteroidia bacterium]|nr:threonylcarbamoyl-AMP synthase [Bacteroidia bacterium]
MLLEIHPDNPQERHIRRAVECLRDGGVIIYPTDTVYGLGCDINNKKAFERICKIRGIKPDKARFSCICEDFKRIGAYGSHISTSTYKLMRRLLPGPYTFILEASREVPRHFRQREKNVGIRMPDHKVPLMLTEMLGNPIVTTSLKADDELLEYLTDPEMIHKDFAHEVDLFIDSGFGGNIPSTILDMTEGDTPVVIREGLGSIDIL